MFSVSVGLFVHPYLSCDHVHNNYVTYCTLVPFNLILVDFTAAVSSGVKVLHIYECEILRSLGNIDAMS